MVFHLIWQICFGKSSTTSFCVVSVRDAEANCVRRQSPDYFCSTSTTVHNSLVRIDFWHKFLDYDLAINLYKQPKFFCWSKKYCQSTYKVENFIAESTGWFFNCSHPKISKCQPVSKLRPKIRTVPTLKKTKKEKS